MAASAQAVKSACPTPSAITEFSGIEYLKIDVASNFGLDKKNWGDRIAWTDKHEKDLESLTKTAKTPALFWASVQAYRAVQAGLPTGYPISLDATASGLQILACLTGCRQSASLCNIVSTGDREDAYTLMYEAMCKISGTSATITQLQAKQCIMTLD